MGPDGPAWSPTASDDESCDLGGADFGSGGGDCDRYGLGGCTLLRLSALLAVAMAAAVVPEPDRGLVIGLVRSDRSRLTAFTPACPSTRAAAPTHSTPSRHSLRTVALRDRGAPRYGRSVPEGDTVYLAGKRMRAALAGGTLVRGELRHPRLVDHDLTGLTVTDVASVGKHLFTRFDDGRSLHSHFRMDGSWHLYPPGTAWQRPAYEARAVLATAERVAVGFALHDLELLPTAQEDRLVGHLGPDLLDPDWSDDHAAEALRRLTARGASELGLVLLEQRVMAGVGNLYKTEVCFLAGLSPWTLVGDVPDPGGLIALSRQLLLRNADRPEQSTTGELGWGRQHWVFERGNQRCRRCGTRVSTAEQGAGIYARPAYWCPVCQPGPAPRPARRRSRRA